MRVMASSVSSVGMLSPMIKLASKQKLRAGCSDSSCCPTSSLGQSYCTNWSQLIPQRSIAALLQPFRCWIIVLFLKFLNLRSLLCNWTVWVFNEGSPEAVEMHVCHTLSVSIFPAFIWYIFYWASLVRVFLSPYNRLFLTYLRGFFLGRLPHTVARPLLNFLMRGVHFVLSFHSTH